ncbi:DsbA family oxidoreductase [Sphingobium sp. EM0848]|uniref:DsbA family oxidoreductase n=1 Tax=Sphingobium sp. EM0848 TaxID=2743473 RepID=UPI00159C2174|nr:DsbA family oxidoreductase [Sphingobium sp. EM0848]
MSAPVKITVTSDFICPWCYIGERRLRRALENLPEGIAVDLDWLPFELNPDMPAEGLDRKAYRSAKFGSWDYSQSLDAKTVEAGRPDGVRFDYDAMTRTPNSFLAHRMALFARQEGKQTAFVEAVLRAYFAEGRDIGRAETLAGIAGEIGLEREAALAFLPGDGLALEVRALEMHARGRGINGVPHFEIGGRVLYGAQPAETIRQAIVEAAALAGAD